VSIFFLCLVWTGLMELTRGSLGRVYPYQVPFVFAHIGWHEYVEVGNALLTTCYMIGFGLVLGVFLGTFLAILCFKLPRLEPFISGASNFTQSVPIFVIIPLLLAFVRSNELVALYVVVSVTFFRAYDPVLSAFKRIPRLWFELFFVFYAGCRSDSVVSYGRFETAREEVLKSLKIELPAIAASIRDGFKLAMPMAVLGALIAEYLVTYKGLGGLVAMKVQGTLDFQVLWLVVWIVCLLSWILHRICDLPFPKGLDWQMAKSA